MKSHLVELMADKFRARWRNYDFVSRLANLWNPLPQEVMELSTVAGFKAEWIRLWLINASSSLHAKIKGVLRVHTWEHRATDAGVRSRDLSLINIGMSLAVQNPGTIYPPLLELGFVPASWKQSSMCSSMKRAAIDLTSSKMVHAMPVLMQPMRYNQWANTCQDFFSCHPYLPIPPASNWSSILQTKINIGSLPSSPAEYLFPASPFCALIFNKWGSSTSEHLLMVSMHPPILMIWAGSGRDMKNLESFPFTQVFKNQKSKKILSR